MNMNIYILKELVSKFICVSGERILWYTSP